MSRFKVGDKVVCNVPVDELTKGVIYEVETYIVGKYYDQLTLVGFHGLKYFTSRFELYKEKEMQEFDKNKLTTGMRVVHKNGEVGIVLKDIGVIVYKDGFNLISDFDDFEVWKLNKVYKGYEAHAKVLDHANLGELIWERKEETEQQKRIRELKETIDNASKQLEELMREMK